MQKANIYNTNLLFLGLALLLSSITSHAQDFSYSADNVRTNNETGAIVFENNVELVYEDLIISSDKVSIDDENKNLTSENISFKVKDQLIWGNAQKISAFKDKSVLRNVEFSLCPCEEKIWWVEAEKVNLDLLNESVDFKNARLVVDNKTIFYFPKGSFPSSGGRRSGFLLPEISISNKSGTDFSVPYYLNLAKNFDLTLEPRLISKRGAGTSTEFRYLNKKYNGYIKSSFLAQDKEYYEKYHKGSFRWSFNSVHNAEIFSNTFLNIKYSNIGDNLFLRDFGGDFNGEAESLFIPQVLKISNFGKNHHLNLKINAFKIINPIGLNQLQELPEVEFDWFKNIENFQYNFNFKFQSLRKGGSFSDNLKQKIERISLSPQIRFSKYYSNFYSEIKFNYIYDVFYTENKEISRTIPNLEANFSSKFFKKDLNKTLMLQPFLSFIFSKDNDQSNLPSINSGIFNDSENFSKLMISGDGYIPMRNDLLIGINYKNFGKNNKNHNIKISKLIGLKDRDLKTTDSIFNLPEPYQAKWSYADDKNLSFSTSLNKDKNDSFDSFSFKFNKNFSNSNQFSLDYIWIKNINSYFLNKENIRKINFIELKELFYINSRTSIQSKIDYDLKNSNLNNFVLGVEYENPGLKIGAAVINSKGLDWFKVINENKFDEYSQESFRIYFELKGLGSLGRPLNQYTRNKELN
jgi:LPS-assembly protein